MKKIILLMAACVFSLNATAAMVVIGNPSGPDALSDSDVKKLFMGKKTKLPNGDNAKIIELVDGSQSRIAFHEATTGRSESQLQSSWARLVFTGKAEAPIQVENDAAVIEAVLADPSAIGYVEESAATGGVKILLKL